MMDAIYYFSVLEMVFGCRFESGRSLLALNLSSEVHWATMMDEAEKFLLDNFETGKVFTVPSYNQGRRYWYSIEKSNIIARSTLDDHYREACEIFSYLHLFACDSSGVTGTADAKSGMPDIPPASRASGRRLGQRY